MKRFGFRALLLALILATLSAPARTVSQPLGQTEAKDSHEPKEFRNLEEFRSVFNRDAGVPCLILLLSPT